MQRRHLSVVQILRVLEAARPALEAEAVARKRAALQGTPPAADPVRTNLSQRGPVNEQIAHMAGVSMNTAKHYHAVQVHGSADLKEAVDQGEVAISDAAGVARQHPPEEQTKALALVRTGEAATLQQAAAQSQTGSARDPLGLPIPDDLVAVFQALPALKEAKACLTRMQQRLNTLLSSPAGTRLSGDEWPVLRRQIREVRTRLDRLAPYTLCPDCLGLGCRSETVQGESLCRGGGFISRRQYQRLSEEAKQRLTGTQLHGA